MGNDAPIDHLQPSEDVAPRSLNTETVAYYARRAAEYESIYAKPERQADLLRLRDQLRDMFAGRDVLELACGTGFWTASISEHAHSVLATDINEEVLQVARAKDWRGRHTTFEIADAFSPEAIPGQFNAAFVGFLWSHVERDSVPAFLNRLNRALSSGALVVFVDNRFILGSSTPIARTDAAGNTYQVRALTDGSRHEILKNFPEERELLEVTSDLTPPPDDISIDLTQYFWLLKYQTSSGVTADGRRDRFGQRHA